MDEAMEFGLPGLEERERLVSLYFDKLIVRGDDAGDEAPPRWVPGASSSLA